MNIEEFNFELPESLIAQTPLMERTASRLLVLNKWTGEINHRKFEDFIQYLEPGDLLIGNNSKVIPARIYGTKKETHAKVEVLLLHEESQHVWEVLVRPAKRFKLGTVIEFGKTDEQALPMLTATVLEEKERGIRKVVFHFEGIFLEILNQLGEVPLPPYIREQLPDGERYQTVFAKNPGSVAAPTAGLHFTQSYLHQLKQKGINTAFITLHVGLGTFRPVSVDSIEDHEMHAEYYEISPDVAGLINHTRQQGKRIVAIGTTAARTLETVAAISLQKLQPANHEFWNIEPAKGWTDIFIYPGYTFQLVDALLTNFHLPKSTLLMMISAMAGKNQVMHAYQEAIKEEYRFFSFGDAMFITE